MLPLTETEAEDMAYQSENRMLGQGFTKKAYVLFRVIIKYNGWRL
jgi:hypothetical protein